MGEFNVKLIAVQFMIFIAVTNRAVNVLLLDLFLFKYQIQKISFKFVINFYGI